MTDTATPFTVELDDDGNAIQPNTLAWLRRRQTGLGASDAPAILNLSRWSSPRDVYLDKIAPVITDEQTEAMEFGHLMEPVARQLFARRHGDPENTRHRYLGEIVPSPGLIRSTKYPHLLASLDSVIVEKDGQAVPGQIKNVTAYKRGAWGEAEGGVPDDVRVQVIQEAEVFGADHGWVLPIFGGNQMPEPIRVDADPEFVAWYTETAENWWAEHVEARVEPAPTLLDDLADLWSGRAGMSVELSEQSARDLERVVRLKALGKTVEEMTDRLLLRIKTEMGEATEAFVGEGKARRLAATWRPYKAPRKTFSRDALLADHPELADLLDAYTFDGKTPRPFLTK